MNNPASVLLSIIILIPSYISGNYQKSGSLEELVNRSDLIIVGEVQDIEGKWDEKRTTINTYITVSVEECIKGSNILAENNVVLMLLGGIIKEEGILVSVTTNPPGPEPPSFGKNERVLLMLRSLSNSKYYAVVTKFHITGDNKISIEDIDKEEFIQKIKKLVQNLPNQ